MLNNIELYIGYLAAILTTFSFLPQAIKTIKTKCTKGISVVMYSMFTTGVFFWLVYGILIRDYVIILQIQLRFSLLLLFYSSLL